MVLSIVTFPNPILTKQAEPVVFPLSKKIQKLTKDMFDTVKKAQGIGLAAPQVGQSVRVVVINLEHVQIPPFVLYNPEIVSASKEKIEIEEGCLSVPGIFGMVRRPKKVTIRAQNAKGDVVEIADDGWVARVAQHEIDHTNGILILGKTKNYTQGQQQVKEWQGQKLL